MTFAGPALQDVGTIQEAFPRQFTLQEVADKLGWDKPQGETGNRHGIISRLFPLAV